MFDNDHLIGAILGTSDGRKGWINRLAIDPHYRKRGLGSVLIEKCEDFLHGLGLKVIAALIEGENTASFAAFKKAGYIYANDIAYYSKRQSADD
jgi:ribosomal protein S18 acetylase RimI-like enzyme